MTANHVLLGFDARDVSLQHYERWPSQRKREWLLRTDIRIPLSVDDMIWPSVLRSDDYEAFFGVAWIGFIQNLWENLPRMQQYIRSAEKSISPYWTIAVALVADTLLSEERTIWDEIVLPTVPVMVEDTWTFFGYDVADRFLSSGLTNYIHYKHADYSQLQSHFLSAINDVHLFDNLDTAIDFRDVSNRRVKHEAPFFVFSVWNVGGCGSPGTPCASPGAS